MSKESSLSAIYTISFIQRYRQHTVPSSKSAIKKHAGICQKKSEKLREKFRFTLVFGMHEWKSAVAPSGLTLAGLYFCPENGLKKLIGHV